MVCCDVERKKKIEQFGSDLSWFLYPRDMGEETACPRAQLEDSRRPSCHPHHSATPLGKKVPYYTVLFLRFTSDGRNDVIGGRQGAGAERAGAHKDRGISDIIGIARHCSHHP